MDASNFTADDFQKWLELSGFGKAKNNKELGTNEADNWESVAYWFGVSYVVIGIFAILLNSLFLWVLFARRRTTFSHAFYIMLINFTLIDTIKGVCSILFSLKLLKSDMSWQDSQWAITVDQYSGMLLRFSNLATILNLLMITMNEYIFMCHPLRYSSLITRRRVVLFVIAAWIISATFTLANMVAGTMHKSIMIDQECSLKENQTSSCVLHGEPSISSHFAYHIGLIIFCLVCLSVTGLSYTILLRVISALVKADMKQTAELKQLTHGENGEASDSKQLVRRHKFVVVIGSVIAVYSVYLTTYAIIQIIQLVSMAGMFGWLNRKDLMYIKYVCYIVISLHSILQPLCYLRMREFRNLLKRTLFGRFRRESLVTEQYYSTAYRRPSSGRAL